MANIPISALPDSLTTQGTDYFPMVRGGVTYKSQVNYVQTFLGFANLAAGFSLTSGTVPTTLNVPVNVTLNQNLSITSSPTFSGLTVSNLNTSGYVKNNSSGVLSTQVNVPITDVTQSSATGNIYYGNGTSLSSLPVSTDGKFMSLVNGIPAWVNATPSIPNPLQVGNITIDGTSNNKISSSFAGNFIVQSQSNSTLLLVGKNIVDANVFPGSDSGAIYHLGPSFNGGGIGNIVAGRSTIIYGNLIYNTGSSSFTLNQSGGIVSLVRNSAGNYTINIAAGIYNNNAIFIGTIVNPGFDITHVYTVYQIATLSTTSVQIGITNNGGSPTDNTLVNFAIFAQS